MSDKYQEHPTAAIATDVRDAVDVVLGMPRKGVAIGKGPHAPIPATHSPGAVGWTEHECDVATDAQSGTALVVVTPAAVAVGVRSVLVNSKTVNVDLTVNVLNTKPAKYDPKKDAPP